MKIKFAFIALAALALTFTPANAKEDAPRGFTPLSEIKEAQAKAEGKKLIVLVVKGSDDQCPNCASALENGLQAVGSSGVKLFARAEKIRAMDATDFPTALKDRIKKGFTTGAAVTFVVFNPDMTTIIAEAGRRELQNDRKATAAFKKAVQAAKKETR